MIYYVFLVCYIFERLLNIICDSVQMSPLNKNGLYEVFDSAFRQLHSMETALLRVQNYIV